MERRLVIADYGKGRAVRNGYRPPPKSKRYDLPYLLARYRRIAARSSPERPESEEVADMALVDALIAARPYLEAMGPPDQRTASPDSAAIDPPRDT